jgi:DNA-binding MarR family transcriptional regulator
MVEPRHGASAPHADLPLGRVLGQVERRLSRLVEASLAGAGLTVDQWRVLDLLADAEGHPMSEIAGAIVVPGPTVTKIVDKLVDAAVVYRLVDGRDRRRVLAFISDDGAALHQRLAPVVNRVESEALEVLGVDAPVLLRLLAQLAEGRPTALNDRPCRPS